MEHLFILFYAATLMVGIGAAYYISFVYRLYKNPYLKSIVHYILFMNVLIFLELASKYLTLNMAAQLGRKSGQDIFVIARYGIGLIAAGGMGYTFSQVVIGLLGKRMNRRLTMILWWGCILITFSYVAGITSYLQNHSMRWLDALKSAMNIVVVVALLASLIWLLLRRASIPEKARRSVITAFVFLYGFCVIAISIAVLLDFPLEWFFVSILLLLMNLVPVIWCKGFFLRSYRKAAPVAFQGILLEKFLETYRLSSREKEILELILQGRSNKEIKDLLYISIHTVRNHVYNIYQKLGVKSRGQLIRLIMDDQRKK